MMAETAKTTLKEDLYACCKKLKLSQAFADRAWEYSGEMGNIDFVHMLMEKEIQQRKARQMTGIMESSRLPCLYEAGQFDDSEVDFPPGESLSTLLELPFCKEGKTENVVMYGKAGAGKTMLSIILGTEACNSGIPVSFYRTDELLKQLKEAHKKGVMDGFADKFVKTRVFILDEFAYCPYDVLSTQLLFRFVSRINERMSIISNTITDFSKWPEMFGDSRLAPSLAGKLMQGRTFLIFRGRDPRFDAY